MKNLYVASAVAVAESGVVTLLVLSVFAESEQNAINAMERAALEHESYAACARVRRTIGDLVLIERATIKEELGLEDASAK